MPDDAPVMKRVFMVFSSLLTRYISIARVRDIWYGII